ncbi:hypothetical protein RND81_14G035800 [Saponaria officinalis]|uniref:Uncharacterized protein n=1 Tax=Saponaria officinalis TaxID=3572 RepID=A0AAW1GLF6_SAPOF
MGRGKIEIKKIENKSSRQVTFSKRRNGLFKKAEELSVLCACDIAVIVYSTTGRLFHFANKSMEQILDRYNKREQKTQEVSTVEHVAEVTLEQSPPQSDLQSLKQEYVKLQALYLRMRGEGLDGLDFEELTQLENQLFDGIKLVSSKKEQVMKNQIDKSKLQEQKARLENEKLGKQVEELKQSLRSSCSESNSSKKRRIEEGCTEKEVDSYNFLRLGLPSTVCCDEKAPKIEATSDESNGQMDSR